MAQLSCDKYNSKIKRAGYLWLDKIWCCDCFIEARACCIEMEALGKLTDRPWDYEMIESRKPVQQKLISKVH